MRILPPPVVIRIARTVGGLTAALGVAVAILTTGCGPVKKAPTTDPSQYRKKEIAGLEQMMREEIDAARKQGASDEQIEGIRSKYQAEIERLQQEERGEPKQEGGDSPKPDAGPGKPPEGPDGRSG
jgi:hypothetical protein